MHENSLQISSLFTLLVDKSFPNLSSSISFFLRFYQNVQKNQIPEYQYIRLLILKSLINDVKSNNDLILIENLLQRLTSNRVLLKTSSVLFLLHLLSNKPNQEQLPLKFLFPAQQLKSPFKLPTPPVFKGSLSDETILTDLVFVLQGLDGSFFRFNRAHNFYELWPQKQQKGLISFKSKSQETLTMKLLETGYLFKKLNHDLSQTLSIPSFNKSLVKSYLVEFFMGEMSHFFAIINSVQCQIAEKTTVSLKSLLILLEQEHERLKWLNILWDTTVKSGFLGCQIINVVYQFYHTYDPNLKQLFRNLMKHIIIPLIDYLGFWMYSGELRDDFNEFFIQSHEKAGSNDPWTDQFSLFSEMTPTFLSPEALKKLLTSGKTAWFLRRFAQDPGIQPINAGFSFENGGFQAMEAWIFMVSEDTNRRAIEILMRKFNLIEEFRLLKGYLLMHDGFFVDFLLNNLKEELQKPVNQIYRNVLMGILEKTIRKTVQKPIIRKRLMENLTVTFVKRSSIIDIGWDLFSLDLGLQEPISLIILERDRGVYSRIFNFLLRVKRFQLEMGEIWRKSLVVSKLLRGKGLDLGSNNNREKEALKMMKQAEITRNMMGFFLNNYLEFLLIEGIESEWDSFENSGLKGCKSIEDVFEAHRTFLTKLQKKFMLLEEDAHLMIALSQLFEHIKAFIMINHCILDDLQDFLLKAQKRKMMEKAREIFEEESEMTLSEKSEEENENFKELEQKLRFPKSILEIKKEFERVLTDFLVQVEKHHFRTTLAFKLNFNEFFEFQNLSNIFPKNPFYPADIDSLLSPLKIPKPTLDKRRSSPDINRIFEPAFDSEGEEDGIRGNSTHDLEYINVFK